MGNTNLWGYMGINREVSGGDPRGSLNFRKRWEERREGIAAQDTPRSVLFNSLVRAPSVRRRGPRSCRLFVISASRTRKKRKKKLIVPSYDLHRSHQGPKT